MGCQLVLALFIPLHDVLPTDPKLWVPPLLGAHIIASAPPPGAANPTYATVHRGCQRSDFRDLDSVCVNVPPYVCLCFYRRVNNVCSFRRKITVIMTIVAMLGYDHSTAVTVNSYDS